MRLRMNFGALPTATPALPTADDVARLSSALMAVTADSLAEDGDPATLVRRYCDAIVEACPRLPLAWCWFGPCDAELIEPQVIAGRARDWAGGLRIRRTWLTRHGPAYRALDGRAGEPVDISRIALWGPWRRAAAEHGIRSVLCVPLPSTVERQCGVFVVYGDDKDMLATTACLFAALGRMFGALLSQSRRSAAMEQAALTDPLTGLGNRLAMAEAFAEIDRTPPGATPSCLVVIDIDHFKAVNDRHGHPAGDAVLRGVALALRAAVRQHDQVVRMGGEEFLVVLSGTTLEQALDIAEKLRARVAAQRTPIDDGDLLCVTCSLGVAACRPGLPAARVLAAADAALYRAKQRGRNCVERAEPPAPPVR